MVIPRNQAFTLLVFWLRFDSVVDIGDVHRVDEGPAQLHPGVHHHLRAEAVPRHIAHLFKKFAKVREREVETLLLKLFSV